MNKKRSQEQSAFAKAMAGKEVRSQELRSLGRHSGRGLRGGLRGVKNPQITTRIRIVQKPVLSTQQSAWNPSLALSIATPPLRLTVFGERL